MRADATSRAWRAEPPQETLAEVAVTFPTEGDIAEMATTWSKTAHSFRNGLTK
jgi:hypothetical protein